MMNKKRLLFVINPIAGSGKAHQMDRYISDHLDHDRFTAELIYTKHPKHASELSKWGMDNEMDIIVSVGGDGSVNEVAKNLVGKPNALAIIPMGSGNGFARHLGIPLHPVKAIQRINDGNIRQIDTAVMNGQMFLNVAGIGFDAEVSNKFADFGKRGFLSYARISMKAFFSYQPKIYKLEIDGNKIESKAFLVAFANSSQYGNNAYIAPKARIDDGMLEICLLKPFSVFALPGIVYHLFNKSLHKSKRINYYKGKKVNLIQPSLLAHYDGESFEPGKELRISINPNSLNVLT